MAADLGASASPAGPVRAAGASRLPPAIVPRGPVRRGRDDDDLPPVATPDDLVREAPVWLFSGIVHLLILLVLGLFLIAQDPEAQFTLSLSTVNDGGEDLQSGEDDVAFDLDEPPLDPGDALEPAQLTAEATQDFAPAPPAPVAPLGLDAALETPAIRTALTGREAGMKESLLRAYGGTSATERAVTEALRWLARNQQSSGSWSLSGPYADGANPDNPEAATALALLAFQGAGYTPASDRKEPFTQVVSRGWNALLKRQKKDGEFFHQGSSHGRLYTQALATIALCELYGMTRDDRYREPAERAIAYCLSAQAPEGGWRYYPGSDSDTSVTGWFVMALQSARMAGLDPPSPALDRISGFLDSVAHDGGAKYAYTRGQGHRPAMTAEGLLCRQYLGWPRHDARLQRGISSLLKNLPADVDGQRDSYYWYYAAQVCHHAEGSAWRTWNAAMREVVPAMQIREGRERGSWNPNEDSGIGATGGGRLFVTCLYAYMLEVYYRHLPLYQLNALQAVR